MRIVRARQKLSNVDWTEPTGQTVEWKDARFHHPAPVPVSKEQIAEATRNYQLYNASCNDPHANLKDWPLWNEPFWDHPEYQRVNNCLAYALMDRDSIHNRHGKPQPGDINGCPGECSDLTDDVYMNRPEEIVRRLRRDFNSSPRELIFPEEEDMDPRIPPPGYYKASLHIAKQNKMFDYHFVRQDSNGFWSHKPGSTPVENVDASGRLITNPETADFFYDPHNKGKGYNYEFYRYIFIKSHSPSRHDIMSDNYEHANKRFALRPDIFYTPNHPKRVPAAAQVANDVTQEMTKRTVKQKKSPLTGTVQVRSKSKTSTELDASTSTSTSTAVTPTSKSVKKSSASSKSTSATALTSSHAGKSSFFSSLFHHPTTTTTHS